MDNAAPQGKSVGRRLDYRCRYAKAYALIQSNREETHTSSKYRRANGPQRVPVRLSIIKPVPPLET